jgi:hypothetical protein
MVLLPEQILFAGKFDTIIQCLSTYLGNPFAFSDSEQENSAAYEKPALFPTIFFGLLHTQLNTATNPKRKSTTRSIQPARADDEITPGNKTNSIKRAAFPGLRERPLFIKNSRHGSEMGVFSEQ